ncbi:MAG: hypothetical protein KY458_13960 [Actinobacteria bacterium]|nr:hypothetical protein [Actinomycetota bacterium]
MTSSDSSSRHDPAEANVTVVALRAVLTVREQQALGGDSTMKHRDVAGDSYCTTCPFRDDDNRLSRLRHQPGLPQRE